MKSQISYALCECGSLLRKTFNLDVAGSPIEDKRLRSTTCKNCGKKTKLSIHDVEFNKNDVLQKKRTFKTEIAPTSINESSDINEVENIDEEEEKIKTTSSFELNVVNNDESNEELKIENRLKLLNLFDDYENSPVVEKPSVIMNKGASKPKVQKLEINETMGFDSLTIGAGYKLLGETLKNVSKKDYMEFSSKESNLLGKTTADVLNRRLSTSNADLVNLFVALGFTLAPRIIKLSLESIKENKLKKETVKTPAVNLEQLKENIDKIENADLKTATPIIDTSKNNMMRAWNRG